MEDPAIFAARVYLLSVSLLAVGCNSGSSDDAPSVQPPAGTGEITIDMESVWRVSDIERIDGSEEPLPSSDPYATPFLSIQLGQVFEIRDGRAHCICDTPFWVAPSNGLYDRFWPNVPNRRYINVADGRYWLFDAESERQLGCSTYVRIQAAFGAVDDDTMDGIVTVQYMTSCPPAAVARPDPTGTFRVRMNKN